MKEQKKWNEMTPQEKKRALRISVGAGIIILLFLIVCLVDCEDSENKHYIFNTEPYEIRAQMAKAGYRYTDLSNDTIYIASYQPKFFSREQPFTDRILIGSKEDDDASAIRFEAISVENNIAKDKDVLSRFVWIGSFLPDSAKACSWIRRNFNTKKAELILDEYTKIQINASFDSYRCLDIFKIEKPTDKSPIPNDGLFWSD